MILLTRFSGARSSTGSTISYADFSEFAATLAEPEISDEKDGPAWSPATFEEGRRRKKHVQNMKVIGFDLDGSGGFSAEDTSRLKEWLEASGFKYVLHDSYSSSKLDGRNKWRLVLELDRECTYDEYVTTWERLAKAIPLEPDPARRTPEGLFYLPRCPAEFREKWSYFSRVEGKTVPVGAFDLNAVEVGGKTEKQWLRELRTTDAKWDTLRRAAYATAAARVERGESLEGLREALAGALAANPVAVKDWDAAHRTIDETIEAGAAKATAELASRKDAAEAALEQGYALDGKLRPTWVGSNLARLLATHVATTGRFAKNRLTGAYEYTSAVPWAEAGEVKDHHFVGCVAWSAQELPKLGAVPGKAFSEEAAWSAIREACELNAYDPVETWISKQKWDGVERLDTWLVDYCGVADTAIARAQGRCWLLQIVSRTRHPGCAADGMLTLIGHQGAGKSTVMQALLGRWVPYSVSDSLPPLAATRDLNVALSTLAIAELSELSDLRKADVEATKAMISTRMTRARAAYGRVEKMFLRRAVFLGTTNEDKFLIDKENRRFWCVRVGRIDLGGLASAAPQIWAEACAKWTDVGCHVLPEALWEPVKIENEEFKVKDDIEEELNVLYEPCPSLNLVSSRGVQIDLSPEQVVDGRIQKISLRQLYDVLGLDAVKFADQNRVRKIIEKMGWSKSSGRQGGKKVKLLKLV